MEKYLERNGHVRLPFEQANAILHKLGKIDAVPDGPFHYTRMIAGTPIRKTMMAAPDMISQLLGED